MIEQPLDILPLPPEQAIAWFKAKGMRLSWDWHDTWQEAHNQAFTVAKVTKLDILKDIRDGLDKALADGTTFEQFKKGLVPTLQRKGWWGKQEAVDTTTGELREVQLGSPYRLKTIFNVNIQTAYQVGHYQAMTDPAVLAARPYWRYSAVMDGHTRPMHRQWNGTVLPADDPWWNIQYPPNGWNCRCSVVSMSMREIERDGLKVSQPPEQKQVIWKNPATGQVEQIPEGIDPGWGYNPGKAASAQIQSMAGERVIQDKTPLRWRLLDDLRREDLTKEFDTWVNRLLSEGNQYAPGKYKTTGSVITVDHLSRNLVEQLEMLGNVPDTTAISITDKDWLHLQHSEQPIGAKRSIENLLTADQAVKLPSLMNNSKAILWDSQDSRLLYVFDVATNDKQGKVVIAVNYKMKNGIGNTIRSSGLVNVGDIKEGKRFVLLEGKI